MLNCPNLCNPMDCTHQAPLSMGFSRQEYWSGLLFPSPGDLPDPGIEPRSPALQADSLPSEPIWMGLPSDPLMEQRYLGGLIRFLWESLGEDYVFHGAFLTLGDFHSQSWRWIQLSYHVMPKERNSWAQQNDSSQRNCLCCHIWSLILMTKQIRTVRENLRFNWSHQRKILARSCFHLFVE